MLGLGAAPAAAQEWRGWNIHAADYPNGIGMDAFARTVEEGRDAFVVLDTAPTANVTIGLSSSDTTEGTLSASSLTFTPLNWNVAQTVTVTGVDDSFIDGNVAFTVVTAAASSTDGNYNGRNASDVSLTNTDNDTFNTLVVDTAADTADGTTTSIAALMANKGADGKISLREAITAANNTANGVGGADRISFNIATALVGGTHTITPTTSLPTITDAVVIDGTSEPDYVVGRPVIEIDGSLTGSGVHGLVLAPGSGGSTIRGLAINGFNSNDGFGLYLQTGSDNNLIAGNVIGLDADGTTAVSVMNNFGIYVASSGNLIGGTTAAARNVLSNNINAGIGLWGSNNVVIGNYIGTDATGTLDRGNAADGVDVFGGSNNRIGGVTAAERNIISGNNRNGIEIAYNVPGTLVQGNYIGTDAGGTLSLGNSLGGIWVGGGATGVTIGGTAAGAGNLIVNNPVGGLYSDTSSVSFTLLGNTFDSNSNLAIDLRGDGVTANDLGDTDTGPNNLQNYPEIGSVVSTGGNTTVTGTLRSNANTTYRLEFFSSPTGDASGYGEGQTYLGFVNVATNSSGNASFSTTLSATVAAGAIISATATKSDAAYATFELENGAIVQINSSWCVRVRRDDLVTFQVDGTHGSAVAGLTDCWTQSRVNTPRPVWNPDVRQTHNFYDDWSLVPDSTTYDNAFKIEWELFLRHVWGECDFKWNLLEAAKGVQLVELGLQSWAERRWIDLPELDA